MDSWPISFVKMHGPLIIRSARSGERLSMAFHSLSETRSFYKSRTRSSVLQGGSVGNSRSGENSKSLERVTGMQESSVPSRPFTPGARRPTKTLSLDPSFPTQSLSLSLFSSLCLYIIFIIIVYFLSRSHSIDLTDKKKQNKKHKKYIAAINVQ